MAKIVLAHGFLGFGSLGDDWVSYFNGIEAEYTRRGHDVLARPVAPLGSIQIRSDQLVEHITHAWGGSNDDIYMIGHSMGGLDCRRVIATNKDIGPRVVRLITICTPHFGSPVASAIYKRSGKLWDALPLLLRGAIKEVFHDDQGALKDLCERPDLQDNDRDGVDYLSVAAEPEATALPSWLFTLSQIVLDATREANDGVVTVSSARGGKKPLGALWPVDHGGAVGWPTDALGGFALLGPPADHIARYVDLLDHLLGPRIKKA